MPEYLYEEFKSEVFRCRHVWISEARLRFLSSRKNLHLEQLALQNKKYLFCFLNRLHCSRPTVVQYVPSMYQFRELKSSSHRCVWLNVCVFPGSECECDRLFAINQSFAPQLQFPPFSSQQYLLHTLRLQTGKTRVCRATWAFLVWKGLISILPESSSEVLHPIGCSFFNCLFFFYGGGSPSDQLPVFSLTLAALLV